MTLTKQQVLDLYNTLNSLGDLTGVRFSYAVVKNINKLKPEVEAINAAYAPKEDFMEYEKKRVTLAEKYAKKVDEKPQTVIRDGVPVYDIVDQDAFDKELEALKKEYKDAVEKRDKQLKDVKELLKEEIDVDLHKISTSDIPQQITATQMAGIFPIVEEERRLA